MEDWCVRRFTVLLFLFISSKTSNVVYGLQGACSKLGYTGVVHDDVKVALPDDLWVEVNNSVECLIECISATSCFRAQYNTVTKQCHVAVRPRVTSKVLDATSSNVVSLSPEPLRGECGPSRACPVGSHSSIVNGKESCVAEDICSEIPLSNVYHFYKQHSIVNKGVVYTLNFTKLRFYTAVRVEFRGDLRGALYGSNIANGQCSRWHFTFNGTECADPDVIDYVNYFDRPNVNIQRQDQFDGICRGIDAGNVKIELRVGLCPGYSAVVDASTNQENGMILIEEVDIRDHPDWRLCPSLSVFNMKYYVTRNADSRNSGGGVISGQTFYYHKRSADTGIHVIWTGSRQLVGMDNCNRWYITFNGSECSNPNRLDNAMFWHSASLGARFQHRTTPIEGYCLGLPAGQVQIALRIHTTVTKMCGGMAGDAYTGWRSPSRFIVWEVKQGVEVDAAKLPDGSVMLLPVFNVRMWGYYGVGDRKKAGVYKAVNYTKVSAVSGLRVKYKGDMRLASGATFDCARWYFTLNGQECANPGPLEGMVTQRGAAYTNFHRFGTVDRICFNISAGLVQIAFNIGTCPGFSAPSAVMTGWAAASYIMAEEVHVTHAQ